MGSFLTWPNGVTLTRIALVFVLVILAYSGTAVGRFLAGIMAVLIILGDWLDGFLARRLRQSSILGSVLDIAADRIIENVLWIILADLDLIPIWIPLIVISRGILTDSIRNYALRFNYAGFGQHSLQKSQIGRFITGSPLMRTPYAVLKAFTFGWLLMISAAGERLVHWHPFPSSWVPIGLEIGYWTAVLAVIVCVVRAIPVLVEGVTLVSRENPDE